MRSLDEPYFSLLERDGWRELWWAVRHRDGKRYLPKEVYEDTKFAIQFRRGKV